MAPNIDGKSARTPCRQSMWWHNRSLCEELICPPRMAVSIGTLSLRTVSRRRFLWAGAALGVLIPAGAEIADQLAGRAARARAGTLARPAPAADKASPTATAAESDGARRAARGQGRGHRSRAQPA